MVVSERARSEMAEALRSVLGEEAAMTLLDHLPPSGWSGVATSHDVEVLRAELHGELAGVRGELAELRGEMRGEFAAVRGEMVAMRAELTTELVDRLATMQRVMITTFVSTLVAFAGLLLAAGALNR